MNNSSLSLRCRRMPNRRLLTKLTSGPGLRSANTRGHGQYIERIGYFDEENFPTGYGEEDDFSLRAVDAGFMLAFVPNAYDSV